MKDHVRDRVRDQVGDRVRDHVGNHVRDNVRNHVRDNVIYSPGDCVKDQTGISVIKKYMVSADSKFRTECCERMFGSDRAKFEFRPMFFSTCWVSIAEMKDMTHFFNYKMGHYSFYCDSAPTQGEQFGSDLKKVKI